MWKATCECSNKNIFKLLCIYYIFILYNYIFYIYSKYIYDRQETNMGSETYFWRKFFAIQKKKQIFVFILKRSSLIVIGTICKKLVDYSLTLGVYSVWIDRRLQLFFTWSNCDFYFPFKSIVIFIIVPLYGHYTTLHSHWTLNFFL